MGKGGGLSRRKAFNSNNSTVELYIQTKKKTSPNIFHQKARETIERLDPPSHYRPTLKTNPSQEGQKKSKSKIKKSKKRTKKERKKPNPNSG